MLLQKLQKNVGTASLSYLIPRYLRRKIRNCFPMNECFLYHIHHSVVLRDKPFDVGLNVDECRLCVDVLVIFRLDALAKTLSVIATATWLAGCPSHSGIVSKRLNLSENFFDHLKAPSF